MRNSFARGYSKPKSLYNKFRHERLFKTKKPYVTGSYFKK